jgi:excisionase family DNA binding protein
MGTARSKIRKRKNARRPAAPSAAPEPRVLTLSEAATYLRVPENAVLKLIAEQGLPGRQIGSEWRFLHSALDIWLCAPANGRGRAALFDFAGRWKSDPHLDELIDQIYELRGRPIGESASVG